MPTPPTTSSERAGSMSKNSNQAQPLIQIARNAENTKLGMTLAELSQFVQEADRAGIDPRSPVFVLAGFSAQVKKLKTGGRP
ncbi:hypothetical protein D3C87_1889990 [compost metagenome]